ncbi:MAG: LapA family protein [Alphaproteobacteria bacterium]
MAIIRFLVGLVLTVLIAGFAVINRFDVTISWNPVSDPVILPFYVVLLGSLLVGFLFGGGLVWLNGSSVRREKRKQKREIKILEKEVERLKQDKFTQKPPAADMFPAISAK